MRLEYGDDGDLQRYEAFFLRMLALRANELERTIVEPLIAIAEHRWNQDIDRMLKTLGDEKILIPARYDDGGSQLQSVAHGECVSTEHMDVVATPAILGRVPS